MKKHEEMWVVAIVDFSNWLIFERRSLFQYRVVDNK